MYLIGLEKQQISTPKNRKRGPDEWMIALPRMGESRVGDSPLEWVVPTQSGKKTERGTDDEDDA